MVSPQNKSSITGKLMMNRFIIADRETDYLLPPSASDWLPENHLARFIAEVVAHLYLTEITNQYQGARLKSASSRHPITRLNLLIYGYATGGGSQVVKLSEHLMTQLPFATLQPIPIQTTIP
jgi:hypothetical protein